ncbi:MAG: UvrD-helicase domain-containing protein, partial [Anaerolineae bacterium]|nr:UvrD-helicase domain-containing protein [Anaerolineae bacterium]
MNLTREQQRAIMTHDRNLIVVAGAGSGKTRVLVERYLALLDAHPDWPLNALVAITFTRKAAQEMRDRVRRALEDRLSQAVSEKEQQVWAGRLASMESARIDTIHGLCTTLLRANAAEAGLDPDFGVMDAVDAAILLDTVIDDEMGRLVEENDPALALFSEYDRRAIVDVLRSFATTPLPDLSGNLLQGWHAAWEYAASESVSRLRANETFLAAAQWQPAGGWPENDKLLGIWEACWPLLADVSNPEMPIATCLDCLNELGDRIKVNLGSAANWGGKDGLAEAKDQLKLIRERARSAAAEIGDPPGPLDERAAQLLPLWVRLIGRVQGAYTAAKQQEGQLDFDDLERLACDLLNDHEAVRLRYRLAEFKHLLVDEFQDTNAAQWTIVQALADPQQPGSLFVVGDPKQSIYAFRGADVRVFLETRQHLTAIGGAGAEIALARSFRTHQPLVDCFNAIFGRILTRDPSGPVYAYETDLGAPMDAHRQEPPDPRPPLAFVLVDASKSEDGLRSDDFRRWEAYEIAVRLRDMVANQTPVFDRETGATRPLAYGDAALLFQSTSQITLYEDVFKALGLPFVTVAGRGYYNRPEVWDLLNLLKALYNPADNLALASVLRSPLFGLSDDALLALRRVQDAEGRRVPLSQALHQPEVVTADELELLEFAAETLDHLAALAGRVTISELLRAALAQTGYLATLTGLPDGARRRGNVEKLLAKADSSGKITLGAFEQYLSDLSAREVREGEALLDNEGAVTLMTVHSSKGLEFPVVVLVDASWERGARGGDAVILDPDAGLCCKVYDPEADKLDKPFAYRFAEGRVGLRETAERKRLLYVAATRAQDYLLVGGQVRQNREGVWRAGGWLDWLLEALELKPHLETPGAQAIVRAWGAVQLDRCDHPPVDLDARAGSEARSAWDQLRLGEPLRVDPVPPPLLNPVPLDPTAAARHLSVTQIADLGAFD